MPIYKKTDKNLIQEETPGLMRGADLYRNIKTSCIIVDLSAKIPLKHKNRELIALNDIEISVDLYGIP
jgi:hypothetical protein